MSGDDVVNGHAPAGAKSEEKHEPSKTKGEDGTSSFAIKAGLAQMLKGGVIMDVVNAEQVRWREYRESK